MFKQQKGITLIALVITIIVLLILAGITIAMLTGSDSAPAKANEAKQKQDIGSAKDQVFMTAQNAQLKYYDDTYVKAGSVGGTATSLANSNSDAGTQIATAVSGLNNNTVGDAKITVDTSTPGNVDGATGANAKAASAKITIETRDYIVNGWIAQAGGALSWGTIATH